MSAVHQLNPEPATFDTFWRWCPKKVDKPLAQAKFEAITSADGLHTRTLDRDSGQYVPLHLKATAEELIEAMKAYNRSQRDPNSYGLKDGGKYTAHPATWLNKGRWMDG